MNKKQNNKLTANFSNFSSNQAGLDLEQKISDVFDEEDLLAKINSYHILKKSKKSNSIDKSGSGRIEQSGRAKNGQTELKITIGLSLLKSKTDDEHAGDA